MVAHNCNLNTQKDFEFEANQGYIGRSGFQSQELWMQLSHRHLPNMREALASVSSMAKQEPLRSLHTNTHWIQVIGCFQ